VHGKKREGHLGILLPLHVQAKGGCVQPFRINPRFIAIAIASIHPIARRIVLKPVVPPSRKASSFAKAMADGIAGGTGKYSIESFSFGSEGVAEAAGEKSIRDPSRRTASIDISPPYASLSKCPS
jgi:hypothetical protein